MKFLPHGGLHIGYWTTSSGTNIPEGVPGKMIYRNLEDQKQWEALRAGSWGGLREVFSTLVCLSIKRLPITKCSPGYGSSHLGSFSFSFPRLLMRGTYLNIPVRSRGQGRAKEIPRRVCRGEGLGYRGSTGVYGGVRIESSLTSERAKVPWVIPLYFQPGSNLS